MKNSLIKNPQSGSVFFPSVFKIIGWTLTVLGAIPLAYRKIIESTMYITDEKGSLKMGPTLTQGKLDMFHFVFLLVVIAGLVMVAWSRDKIEDERLLMLRVRSIIIAFVLGVLFVLGYTLAQVMSGLTYWPFFGIELVTGMLLTYNICFLLLKKFVQ